MHHRVCVGLCLCLRASIGVSTRRSAPASVPSARPSFSSFLCGIWRRSVGTRERAGGTPWRFGKGYRSYVLQGAKGDGDAHNFPPHSRVLFLEASAAMLRLRHYSTARASTTPEDAVSMAVAV